MTAYNAGEAFLQIVPSFKGVVEAIEAEARKWGARAGKAYSGTFDETVRKETGKAPVGPSTTEAARQGEQSGGKFAAAFRAQVTAALKSLPDVEIGVAANAAEQKLRDIQAQLLALSNKRIGVDIDEAEALAEIDRLKADLQRLSAESTSIALKVDSAAAVAALDRFRATAGLDGERAGGAFGEAFTRRVGAALKSLPDAKINADSSDADIAVAALRAELAELSSKTIGIDIDEGIALAQIDRLQAELERLGAESPSVQVRMDTAAAAAELARFRAEIDRTAAADPEVEVKADTAAADAKLDSTRALTNDLDSASPDVDVNVITGPALAAISTISAALAALTAGAVITPVVGGAAAMLGPLSAAIGGVGGVGASALPGLSAVKEAYTAQTAAAKDAATSAETSAKAQVSAANQVKTAQLSLADTERRIANDRISSAEAVAAARQGVARAEEQAAQQTVQAEQRVQAAEQALAGAQRASLDAQKALTDARDQATRSLQDQAFAAKDAGLQLQADQLAVRAAQDNLKRVNADAKATDLQRQEAALALAQAQQRLAEQQVNVQRVTEDNTKAQKAGVDGSPQVVAANQRITQAQDQRTAAAKALDEARANQAKTERAADQSIADAERNLADARRAQVQRAAQAESDLTRAHLAVAQAQSAAAAATDSGSAATRNLAYAMGELTPAETSLLDATNRFKTAFTGWAQALEPQVLPLFTGGLDILGKILPKLTPLVTATADALGKILERVSAAVDGPGFTKFIGVLTDLVGPTLDGIADVAGSLGSAFANLVTAFAPLSKVVIGGLAELADKLADASKSPALKAFADVLVALGPQVVDTVSDLGGLAGKLLAAFAPLSGPVLSVIDTLARALGSMVDALGGPLAVMFKRLAPIIGQLITALLPPLTVFFAGIIDILPDLAEAFVNILIAMLPLLPVIVRMLDLAVPFLNFLAPLAPYILAAFGAFKLLAPIIGVLMSPFALLALAIGAVAGGLIYAYNNSETFHDYVNDHVVPVLKSLAEWVTTKLLPALANIGTWIKDNVLPALGDLWDYLSKVVFPILKTIAEDALEGLKSAFDTVTKAVRDHKDELIELWHAFQDVIKFIVENVLPVVGPILKEAFKEMGNIIAGAITGVALLVEAFDGIVTAAKTIAQKIGGAFGSVKTAVSEMWQDVQRLFTEGVNFVTTRILNPLIDMLNKVLGPFGVNLDHLYPIVTPDQNPTQRGGSGTAGGTRRGQAFADGGVLPGYSPGRDVHQFYSPTAGFLHLSGGEGILRPELVQALGGAPAIDALNAPFNGGARGSGRAFAVGGVLGALGTITDKIRSGAAGAAISGLSAAEAPIRDVIDHMPLGFVKGLAAGILRKLNAEVAQFIRGTAKRATAGASTAGLPAAAHRALIDQALTLAGVPVTEGNEANVDLIVKRESGWNPNAINLWDSNAQAGHPSQGLMQTIPTTFAAYALPGLGGITNPLANLVAGIRYAISTYGSLGNVPGVRGVNDGSGYVGYDNGGFLPPGVTTVCNGTGSPEPVFTSAQFAMLAASKSTDNRTAAPSEFRGDLYLDSGEFLGVVRGELDNGLHELATESGRVW
jgi:phage-related protein